MVSQSNVLVLAAIPVALWTGRIGAAERHLASLMATLNQRELAIWDPTARFFEGMIRHERGDGGGIEQMRAALGRLSAANFLVRMPMYLTMLAEAALQQGREDVARDSVTSALAMIERQEELWCMPEAVRVRGLLHWRDGDRMAAEQTLLGAVKLADAAGALSFELRATLNLAELWAADDRSARAVSLLEPLCRHFDPAAESTDIARARHLLERLHARPSRE